MKLTAWFGKKSNKVCPCCSGVGEHGTGFECYTCDGGGTLYPGEDPHLCDGRYNDGGPSHNFGGLGPEGIMCVYPHPTSRRTAGEYGTEPSMEFGGVKSWTQARQYGAEDRMATQLPEHPIGSAEEAQKIADKVTKKAGVRPVGVFHTPGRNYSFAQAHPERGMPRIVLGDGGMNHSTLLHELAHHIDREKGSQDEDEPHGDSFRDHFEQTLVDHHPNSYVAREAFRDKFQQTDQLMRMGMPGRWDISSNPEMNEREKAQPSVPEHKPMWEHNPETMRKAKNALENRSEPHTYRKYMNDYPELDYEHDDDYERGDAHMADEDLEKGMHPRLVPPHMLDAWVKHHPNPKALEDPEFDDEDREVSVRKQAAEDSDDPGLIHRGLSVVLPQHIHDFVHDENQPAGARAHMLLAHVRKARPEITSEEARGTTGGLGNYWSPRKEKADEYGSQGGWGAYHNHEREHGCGDDYDGYGGCPTTHVVLHAGTPPEKDHWTEHFRDGERYSPEHSWRLPVRPNAKLMVHGISWKQGHDNESGTRRDFSAEKVEPYSRYDFLRPMRKRAAMAWDVPHEVTEPIHRGITLPLSPEDAAHVHDTSIPARKRSLRVIQLATERGGLGRHWSTDEDMANHFSPTGAHDLAHHEHLISVLLHAKPPHPEHIEHDPAELSRMGVQGQLAEREVPLKSGAPVRLYGVDWQDTRDSSRSHGFSAGAGNKGILRQAGTTVPPGTMGTDSEGHGVQMTVMDGWAHRDGSHGHEDGPDIGDRPVYTQDHTWLPNGRYWGPNSAQNDQRLFEGDHLRPEVRQDILDRVGGVLGAYGDWEKWTRVYFAGSQAAQWLDQNGQGNGDFDILIGINFEDFRDGNPQFEEMEDAEIASTLTDELWAKANAKEYYFTLADGRSVGPFDRTFYCNARAWNIKNLHPYAAYNVTDDDWAVHPLQVPQDWDATRLPESYWGYAEALLHEIQAIGQLPAEERHRMAANLYEELHNHRSDAFADGGHGLFDLSNIVEKYMDQHPDKPWERLVQWKNESPSGPEPWVPTTARRTTLTELLDPKTAASGADYGGVMIALVPPRSICEKLAQEDGEPVDAMHITLAYMPGLDRGKAGPELKELVQGWARTQKALTARIGGVGTFVNPGEHVLWAAVDIPHGGPFRQSLVETLERHGYDVANDHGWTPHVTLDYRDHHVRFLPKVEPATWDVTEVHVCVGDNWTAVPLG